jgi:hypothetical protein
MGIVLQVPDAVPEDGAFEPSGPDCRVKEVQGGMGTAESKDGVTVDACVRIADALNIVQAVIVEVDPGAVGCAQMNKDGANAPRGELFADIGNVADGLAAERTTEVAQKDQQDR